MDLDENISRLHGATMRTSLSYARPSQPRNFVIYLNAELDFIFCEDIEYVAQ